MIDADRILQMIEGGQVKRCHCLPHHGHYDVAQHTFNMLILLDELWPHVEPNVDLMRHILRHDLFERWTGDMPCMSKSLMPGMKEAINL